MAEIQRARTIAALVQEIWDLLADFGALSSWADNADHSCVLHRGPGGQPVGTARRVQIKREVLVERITEFDPPRALGYDIDGLPKRLRRIANRWTLAPAAPDCTSDSTVVMLTSIRTDPDLHELRQHLRSQLKQARANSVPERNRPWPYASRCSESPASVTPLRDFARNIAEALRSRLNG